MKHHVSIKHRITPEHISHVRKNEIFVFGSNTSGKHLGGAARAALCFGAEWGKGEGLCNNTYAFPTATWLPLGTYPRSIENLAKAADKLFLVAKEHPELIFLVTPVGCGIVGLHPKDVAPLFKEFVNLENVKLPKVFWDELMPRHASPFQGWYRTLLKRA